MQWPVCWGRNIRVGERGCWRRSVLYQFHTVGSRENLIPFHPSLSRCHSLPQVVIALTASSRLLEERGKKEGGKPQSSEPVCFWVERKMTYRSSTDTGWCCITHCCNKRKRGKNKCIVQLVSFKRVLWIRL